jgi:hypothetical protein
MVLDLAVRDMETIAQTQWFPFTLMGTKMILSRRKRGFPGTCRDQF